MLKDNWEDKNGINLPGHPTCTNRIQSAHVANMMLQPPQGFSNNDYLGGSSNTRNLTAFAPSGSNLQGNRYGVSINEPKSVEPVRVRHQFDDQFRHQNHLSENRPTFIASYNMVSELQTMPVTGTHKPIDNVCSQTEAHKSLLPQIPYGTDAGKSVIGSNLQELMKLLSTANALPKSMPLEMGSSEYLRLVEILQQSCVKPNGISDKECSQEEFSATIKAKEMADDGSSICRDNDNNNNNKEKVVGCGPKNNLILGPLKMDEKKLPSEKASRIVAEKLWDGSLQLSTSVTLSAVAFFKSGEKLLGNNWPESIEVKGKVRLEAFEKYVQDLPRSRNRGLMVISLCWKEGSSDIGLTGMKEVAKGYQRSARVGFAQLLSGIDLYICPHSDPIITILAKYGFFKGMAVIDDKQDSMIGCVVWRKNRPLNPVEPQKQGAEKKLSPEKLGQDSSQPNEPVTAPSSVASAEVDHNGGNSNTVGADPCNLVRKRPFEDDDDDLPEFDFGIACGKSTPVSQPRIQSVNCQKLDNSRLTQLPSVTNNGSLEQSSKKTKLFDDDDDDMPEWCPPELHNQKPPSNFQNLSSCPVRRLPIPPPPPPPGDTRSSFSYQPLQPPVSCPRATFIRAPPPPPPLPLPPSSSSSSGLNSNQALRHLPSSNINPSFPSSIARRPRP